MKRRLNFAGSLALVLGLTLVLSPVLLASAALADDAWPSKPIRFVVPFGPGGANDIVSRAVADAVSKVLHQTIIIDNRPGAGSDIGNAYVAHAAPDGYTFLTPAAGVITNFMIRAHMNYKEDDLVPVVMLAVSPSVIIVPAESPIHDLKSLVAASKQGQGLNFSTAGTGSTPHFVAEMLRLYLGAHLQIIPYRSGGDSVAAVAGKQVEATSEGSPVVLGQIRAGRLRAIASTWNQRIAALPELPTAQEQGFHDIFIGHWTGVFAPKGTPQAILDKLNAAVNMALKSPELRAKLSALAIEPTGGTREDFRKFLAAERARLGPIAQSAQMREDN